MVAGVIELDIEAMDGQCRGCDMSARWAVEVTEVLGTQSWGVKDSVSSRNRYCGIRGWLLWLCYDCVVGV